MLYLAIDLHRKQMTINLRGEDGEPILRRQVSTWEKPGSRRWPCQHSTVWKWINSSRGEPYTIAAAAMRRAKSHRGAQSAPGNI